jgi:porphobilinogen synthase
MTSDLVGPSAGGGRFPAVRPRRLRRTAAWRGLVAETIWAPRQLILPMFVREDATEPTPIASMPGVVQHSRDSAKRAVAQAAEAGLGGVMIFGVPTTKDALGTGALNPDGILNVAVRDAVGEVGDALVVGADLCLDEFTDHGHCGVLAASSTGEVVVDNDATLAVYAQMAVALADAGAGVVAPSGMMDGQVGAIRTALDAFDYAELPIMAYAAKYASAFYGPFREAVASSLQGNRATYQQDNANVREALREVRLDVGEGADVVMVKPALGYLDVLAAVRAEVDVPVAAYNVSGEYAMVEAAAANGWIDRERTIVEILTGIRRAGADMILTYWAVEAAGFSRAGR